MVLEKEGEYPGVILDKGGNPGMCTQEGAPEMIKSIKAFVYVYSLDHKSKNTHKQMFFLLFLLCDSRNTHKQMFFLLFLLFDGLRG